MLLMWCALRLRWEIQRFEPKHEEQRCSAYLGCLPSYMTNTMSRSAPLPAVHPYVKHSEILLGCICYPNPAGACHTKSNCADGNLSFRQLHTEASVELRERKRRRHALRTAMTLHLLTDVVQQKWQCTCMSQSARDMTG